MFALLSALNVSGVHPELACALPWPFLVTLTDPDADHVHYVVTDEGGDVHCCECSHPGERPNEWDPNRRRPTYPVTALVTEWPDADRAREDEIDTWWIPVPTMEAPQ